VSDTVRFAVDRTSNPLLPHSITVSAELDCETCGAVLVARVMLFHVEAVAHPEVMWSARGRLQRTLIDEMAVHTAGHAGVSV
jgi:hypothetical protein